MRPPVSASFFREHPVFDRDEYAAAVGRQAGDPAVSAMLAHHLQAGNVKRVTRGVFASVPGHADAENWPVDPFLAAAWLRKRGCIIAYYSALDLHGYAHSVTFGLQVIAPGRPGLVKTRDFFCRFVRPPPGFAPPDGVTAVPYMGLTVPATTLARTIVDLFHRPAFACGAGELFDSLSLIDRVSVPELIRHMGALGNAAAAGALGFWLDRDRQYLNVRDTELERLHALAPKRPRYALGARPGAGKLVRDWNVILPRVVVEPYREEFPCSRRWPGKAG